MLSVWNEGKFFFAKNAGKISEEEFQKALKGIVTGPGACPMIGTAITMQTPPTRVRC
jgi:dihydroxyacid dehydratase/phosphogluconate dehydratase